MITAITFITIMFGQGALDTEGPCEVVQCKAQPNGPSTVLCCSQDKSECCGAPVDAAAGPFEINLGKCSIVKVPFLPGGQAIDCGEWKCRPNDLKNGTSSAGFHCFTDSADWNTDCPECERNPSPEVLDFAESNPDVPVRLDLAGGRIMCDSLSEGGWACTSDDGTSWETDDPAGSLDLPLALEGESTDSSCWGKPGSDGYCVLHCGHGTTCICRETGAFWGCGCWIVSAGPNGEPVGGEQVEYGGMGNGPCPG